MSAIHYIEKHGSKKEIVAYGDITEYAEEADFSSHCFPGPKTSMFRIEAVDVTDSDTFIVYNDEVTVLNDGCTYVRVNFGEDDSERQSYVDVLGLYTLVYIIYMWDSEQNRYIAYNGVAYPSADAAWDAVED